uniref:Uncharacterized protein n=1 Tax=Arundo donax TaxID=35708 RepID=A0A0A9CNL5_ARUDO
MNAITTKITLVKSKQGSKLTIGNVIPISLSHPMQCRFIRIVKIDSGIELSNDFGVPIV